jgi:hypothetical protein
VQAEHTGPPDLGAGEATDEAEVVEHHQLHGGAEAERGDGEVDAPRAHRRQREHRAEKHGGNDAGDQCGQ